MALQGLRDRMSSLRSKGGIESFGNVSRNGRATPKKGAARIDSFLFLNHFQGSPSTHILRYRKGELVEQGKGLSFWFRELNTSVAEVPVDDQELPFLFSGRSKDFQDVNIQGIVTYRVADPSLTANRIDFTLDLDEGGHRSEPRVKIESFLTQMAQEAVTTYLASTELASLVDSGLNTARDLITTTLTNNAAVAGIGLEIVNVSVASLRPRADVEKMLQVPTFEQLQERADAATFDRREKAVEKEQKIQAADLTSKIALAQQREALIAQEGANQKAQTQEAADAQLITTKAQAEQIGIRATADAQRVTVEGEAEAEAQRVLLEVFAEHKDLLTQLAFRTLAENLGSLSSLSVTPDVLAQLAGSLVSTNGNGNGHVAAAQ